MSSETLHLEDQRMSDLFLWGSLLSELYSSQHLKVPQMSASDFLSKQEMLLKKLSGNSLALK